MNTYIGLLRGINVGGQKKIKMAELREHLSHLNFENLQTYIQSGNLVFNFKGDDNGQLQELITNRIKEVYEFEVPTMIRSKEELGTVLNENPYLSDNDKSINGMYVTFLEDYPSESLLAKMAELVLKDEEYTVKGKSIYLYFHAGFGKAKMNNNFFENKLKVRATTRNWKTINKLWEMCMEH